MQIQGERALRGCAVDLGRGRWHLWGDGRYCILWRTQPCATEQDWEWSLWFLPFWKVCIGAKPWDVGRSTVYHQGSWVDVSLPFGFQRSLGAAWLGEVISSPALPGGGQCLAGIKALWDCVSFVTTDRIILVTRRPRKSRRIPPGAGQPWSCSREVIFAFSNVCYLERIPQGVVWLGCEAEPFIPSDPGKTGSLDYKPNVIPLGRMGSSLPRKEQQLRIIEKWNTVFFFLGHFFFFFFREERTIIYTRTLLCVWRCALETLGGNRCLTQIKRENEARNNF